LTTATLLAQRGFRVILVDIQAVEEQARGCARWGDAHGVSGDVSSESFVQKLAEWSAAATARWTDGEQCRHQSIVPAEQTSAEQWQRVMAINLFAPFCCAAIWVRRC